MIEANNRPDIDFTTNEIEQARLDTLTDLDKQAIADFVFSFIGTDEEIDFGELKIKWETWRASEQEKFPVGTKKEKLMYIELNFLLTHYRERVNLPYKVAYYLHKATDTDPFYLASEVAEEMWKETYQNPPDMPKARFYASMLRPGWTGGAQQPQNWDKVFLLQTWESKLEESEQRFATDPLFFSRQSGTLILHRVLEFFDRQVLSTMSQDGTQPYILETGLDRMWNQIRLLVSLHKDPSPIVKAIATCSVLFRNIFSEIETRTVEDFLEKLPPSLKSIIEEEKERTLGKQFPPEYKQVIQNKIERITKLELQSTGSPSSLKKTQKDVDRELDVPLDPQNVSFGNKIPLLMAAVSTCNAQYRTKSNLKVWQQLAERFCRTNTNAEIGHIAQITR